MSKKKGPDRSRRPFKRKLSEKMSKIGWRIDPLTGKRVSYRKED